jgi:phosphatidate phosphatase APP1
MNKVLKKAAVVVYPGYGHTHDLIVFGHVFNKLPAARNRFTNNILANIFHLLRLFFIKPIGDVAVQLVWRNRVLNSFTESDGFYKFEWQSEDEVLAGWHDLAINCLDASGNVISTGKGQVFVPNSTQYGFISDIDDTVLISHSATKGKRLRVLFTKNPRTRKPFADVVTHYELLSVAHTTPQVPNPFFYVSSSEWNLFYDLKEFFSFNKLPPGVFLLNQVKRWYQMFKTGKTKHEGKMLRIVRILATFPKQQFILFGDNSQADPSIYAAIAAKYPGKIHAIYINNVHAPNEAATKEILAGAEKNGVFTCFYKNSRSAIEHSKAIGLISWRDSPSGSILPA